MRSTDTVFRDRVEAGKLLAERLQGFAGEHPVVLGLARGGVIVAAEIAQSLHAPLDVMVARKIGAPFQPELGIGAVAPGVRVVDDRLARTIGVQPEEIERLADREEQEVERRIDMYHVPLSCGGQPEITGRTVILVDDGLATGVTALASIRSLRKRNPKKIIVAFPVCSSQGRDLLAEEADEVICLTMPPELYAVGAWYEDFTQTTDDEVIDAMREQLSLSPSPLSPLPSPLSLRERQLQIDIREAVLNADLQIPEGATGLVLFAHGSGSSRKSPRNRFVAAELNHAGLATLLADLLTEKEEREDEYTAALRFDIGLLADRLHAITQWAAQDPDMRALPMGYFGASTGAAAALIASTRNPNLIKAIVSRGGRPDLAGAALPQVSAPTLLIVGSHDYPVITMNEEALQKLGARDKKMVLVDGATHLFEEPGALEQVAELARHWFTRHLL